MDIEWQDPITVLVADPQPLFLAGLSRVIRLDAALHLVAEVDDDRRYLDEIRRVAPEVAVIDAGPDVARILTAVAQLGLSTRVLLAAAEVAPDSAFDALAAGARGYISKRARPDVVRDAIRRIAAGGTVLCEEAQNTLTSEIRLRYQADRALLTPRELDVLTLMRDGLTMPAIGRELHLSTTTVKTYAARAYDRLGARDRLGAVVEAMRRGILD
jgi:two-component system, NarL family, nitrate/nitrite response regulator NarL